MVLIIYAVFVEHRVAMLRCGTCMLRTGEIEAADKHELVLRAAILHGLPRIRGAIQALAEHAGDLDVVSPYPYIKIS